MKIRIAFLAAASAAALSAAPFKDGDRVVFLGDSITHHGRYHEMVALYYATRFPDADVKFANAGESGGSAGSAMRRLADDVAAFRPTHVAVMFGMNDVNRNQWPTTGETEQNRAARGRAMEWYKGNTKKLVSKIAAECGNPEIIYVTPSPYDQTCVIQGQKSELRCNDGLQAMGEWVKSVAAEEKRTVADLQTFLRELNAREQAKDPEWSFMRLGKGKFDRVHPGAFGHQLFAYKFLKDQGAPATVSKLSFDAARGVATETANAEVTDLKATASSLSFTALEKALPYPMQSDALAACAYAPIMEELNAQTLKAAGLEKGLYELKIDGKAAGRWTAAQLAAGVNLATNATPQSAQAHRVLKINRELWNLGMTVRDVKMWRLWQKGKAPVEDMAKYAEWFAKQYPDGKPKGFHGFMAKQYLVNAPKLKELGEKCAKLEGEVRAAAKCVPHRWELAKVSAAE